MDIKKIYLHKKFVPTDSAAKECIEYIQSQRETRKELIQSIDKAHVELKRCQDRHLPPEEHIEHGELKLELAHKVAMLKEAEEFLRGVPNEPDESVPLDENDVFLWGNIDRDGQAAPETVVKNLNPGAKPHWEHKDIGLDFEDGVKVSGSGFPFYRGKAARTIAELVHFFYQQAIADGYEFVVPPLLVNEESCIGTGQIPDKEGMMYKVEGEDKYLIPTAEVPLTNMFADSVVDLSASPKKVFAYTPCFRYEAGSYGKDTRGLNRLHQFGKLERVILCRPEDGLTCLDVMIHEVARLIEALELPYRIVEICAKELGFTQAKQYDFEVYASGQKKWLEVSSVSWMKGFQARRAGIRYKGEDGKNHYAHTINGSALAIPRVLAAMIENDKLDVLKGFI